MSRLRVAENVGVDVVDDVVYVAPLPDGPIAVLDGIAAFIWEETLGTEREHVAWLQRRWSPGSVARAKCAV